MADTMDLRAVARAAAQKYGVDPDIFERQISQESRFNPNAVSPAGARGVAQFTSAAAQDAGVNPSDPVASLDAAAKRMRAHLDSYGGDYHQALAAYNAGPGNVKRYRQIPETSSYVDTIMGEHKGYPQGQRPITDLGKAVKSRWPGKFDQFDDATVGQRFKAYWQKQNPNAYNNFSDQPAGEPATPGVAAQPDVSRGTTPAKVPAVSTPPWAQPTGLQRLDTGDQMPPPIPRPRDTRQADEEAAAQQASRLAALTPDQRRQEIAVQRAFPTAMGENVAGPPMKGELPFADAQAYEQEFARQGPVQRALLRVGKGVRDVLPSLDTSEAPASRTPTIPQAQSWKGRTAEGVGGLVTFGAESALLSALGAPEAAAAGIPAAASAGSVEKRALAGVTTAGATAGLGAAAGAIARRAAGPGAGTIEEIVQQQAVAAEGAAKAAGASDAEVRAAGDMAERQALARAARAGGLAHHVGGPVAFGAAQPWAQIAAQKLLGDKNAQWPTAREMMESGALLAGAGLGGHVLEAGGELARKSMGRAKPEAPPPAPATSAIPPEKEAAFEAIRRHLAEPGLPTGLSPADQGRMFNLGREASQQLTQALGGKPLQMVVDGRRVQGELAYARVFPYPGVENQVRLLVRDPGSDQLVPFAFKDLAAMRQAVNDARRPALVSPASPEQAKQGFLRITQPPVMDELIGHAQLGRDLHPVADDAVTRATRELSGIVTTREIRKLARSSVDGPSFKAGLAKLMAERMPGAVPEKATRLEDHELAPMPEKEQEAPRPKDRTTAAPRAGRERVGGAPAPDERIERPVEPRAPVERPKPAPREVPAADDAEVQKWVGQYEDVDDDATRERYLKNLRTRAEGEGQRPEVQALAKRVLDEIGRRQAARDKESARDEKDTSGLVDEFNGLPREDRERWIKGLEKDASGDGTDADLARQVRARIFEQALERQGREHELDRLLDQGASDDEVESFVRDVLGRHVAAEPKGYSVRPIAGKYAVVMPDGTLHPGALFYTEKSAEDFAHLLERDNPAPPPEVNASYAGGGGERANANIADILRRKRGKEAPGGAKEAGPNAPTERGGPGPGVGGAGRAPAGRGEPGRGAEPGDLLRREWEPRVIEARAEHSKRVDDATVDRQIPEEFRGKLRDHQKQSVAKMLIAMKGEGGGLLASGTGAGKTRIQLVIAQVMRREGRAVLVVSPSQVIKQSWDAATFAGDFKKSADALGIHIALWNAKYKSETKPLTMAQETGEQGNVIGARVRLLKQFAGAVGRVVHVDGDLAEVHLIHDGTRVLASNSHTRIRLEDLQRVPEKEKFEKGDRVRYQQANGRYEEAVVLQVSDKPLSYDIYQVRIRAKDGSEIYVGSRQLESLETPAATSAQLEAGHIYLTTLEQVKNLKPDPNLVLILDESHKFKNPTAGRTQAMLKLIDAAHSVLAASATPKDTINNLHYLKRSGILEGGTFRDMVEKLGLRLVDAKIPRDLNPGETIGVGDRVRFEPFASTAHPRYPVTGDVTSVGEKGGLKQYTIVYKTPTGIERTYIVDENMGGFKKFERALRIVPQKSVTAEQVHKRQEALFDRMTAAGRMVRHEISLDGVPIHITTIPAPADLGAQMRELEQEVTDGKGADGLQLLEKARVKMLLRRHLEHLKIEKAAAAAIAMVKNEKRQVVIFADRVNETIPNKFELQLVDGQWQRVKVPLEKFRTPGSMPELKKILEKAGLRVGEIHGGVDPQEQLEAMREFQAGNLDVIIATPYSGGTGIDLDHQSPDGRHRGLVMITAPFDAMNYVQAIGRVVRLETISRPTIVVFYIDHPIDTWGRDIITRKMRDLGATVKGNVPILEQGQGVEGQEGPEFSMAPPAVGPTMRRRPPGAQIPATPSPGKPPSERQSRGLPTATVPQLPTAVRERAIEKARKTFRAITAIANPVHGVPGRALDLLMKAKGSVDRLVFRVQNEMAPWERYWDKRSKEQVMSFFDSVEHGKAVDPILHDYAAQTRTRLDNVFKAIRKYKNIPYWDNYFVHIWKNPEKVRETAFLPRRPAEGSKRFLRKRFYQDLRQGMEAGLEPVDWNPERLVQRIEADAAKFVAIQRMRRIATTEGYLALVRNVAKPPDGFVRLDQPWTKVYMNPNRPVKEYYDQRVMDGLNAVARSIGASVGPRDLKSPLGMKQRNVLGAQQGVPGTAGRIQARFATPLDVLAHELGHAIDTKFLNNGTPKGTLIRRTFLRGELGRELTALADLRAHAGSPESFKRYVRKDVEKMAVMLQALVHAPEEFQRVAPKLYEKYTEFLATTPELKPLTELKPSLLYGSNTTTVHAGGIVQSGDYWVQPDFARVLNNWMSKDELLAGNLSVVGRPLLAARNKLNAMQLGASAFHATSVSLLSVMHRAAVGVSDIAAGDLARGLGKIASSPAAPILYAHEGWKFFNNDAEAVKIEKDLFEGGAALHRAAFMERVGAGATFMQNARRALAEGAKPIDRTEAAGRALAAAPWAAVELPIHVLSRYYIPQIQVAAFRDLFSSEMRRRSTELNNGTVSRETIARLAFRDVQDRMGALNYDNLFWNNTLKSAVLILTRAPGWKLGTVRAFGGGFFDYAKAAAAGVSGKRPQWTNRMSFALTMTMTSLAAAGVYHYIHTGRRPETLKDYLFPQNGDVDEKGNPVRVSFPTYMRDLANMRDPVKYAVGKIEDKQRGTNSLFHGGVLSPLVTEIVDLLENQSYRGPIRDKDAPASDQVRQTVKYLFGTNEPFSVQQFQREQTPERKAESLLGITQHFEKQPGRPQRRRFKESY